MLPPFLACLPHKCMHWHCTYVALARTRTPPPATTRGAAYDLRPSCSARTLIEPVVVQSSHYERVQCTVYTHAAASQPSWARGGVRARWPAGRVDTGPRGHARLSRRAAPAGDRGAPLQGAAACACLHAPPRAARPLALYIRGYATTARTRDRPAARPATGTLLRAFARASF